MDKTLNPGTGIDNLDRILGNLKLGDNVVWQVDSVKDYRHFVSPYVERALDQGRHVIYIRFASHEPMITLAGVEIHELDASDGFENFSKHP